ncbi:MAG: hypothetical protein ACREN2_03800 [Candidatus Dormibacteria bacterium]
MNLFRSEEHLDRWLAGRPRGAVIPVAQLRDLADVWYGDHLSPRWRPRSRDDSEAILDSIGLTGDFWQLP